ncbi:hypothetical protein EMCRGX_G016066 [Ephydatia muelleri]
MYRYCRARLLRSACGMNARQRSRVILAGVSLLGLVGGILTWWRSEAAVSVVHDLRPPSLHLSRAQLAPRSAKEQLDQRLSEYCHKSLLQFVDASAASEEAKLSGDQQSLELVQVHVIARHGDRSPAHAFDMGPKQNFTCGLEGNSWAGLKRFAVKPLPPSSKINLADFPVFPGSSSKRCGVGMLTGAGFRQHYTLGAMIRQMYHDFLSTVKPDQIFVHSTSFQRTVQSAAAFLHGYSRDDEAGIPIHISDGDVLSAPPVGVKTTPPCKKLGAFYRKLHTGVPDKERWQDLVESIQATFGLVLAVDTGEAAIRLADHVMARLCHQFTLPCNHRAQCLDEASALELIEGADVAWKHRYTQEYSVVAMRPFMQHSLEVMDAAVRSKHTYKLLLSFAHDSTLAMVLDTLGVKSSGWMPYVSRVVMELWKSRKDGRTHFVRVLFNGLDITGQIVNQTHSGEYTRLIEYNRWRSMLLANTTMASYQECVNMTSS